VRCVAFSPSPAKHTHTHTHTHTRSRAWIMHPSVCPSLRPPVGMAPRLFSLVLTWLSINSCVHVACIFFALDPSVDVARLFFILDPSVDVARLLFSLHPRVARPGRTASQLDFKPSASLHIGVVQNTPRNHSDAVVAPHQRRWRQQHVRHGQRGHGLQAWVPGVNHCQCDLR
jgi:hypothetical protein